MECDIQDALEDLGFGGALLEEGALTIAVQGEKLTADFMALCVWLSENFKSLCSKLQEHVTEKEDEETFRMEMSALLNELGCPHSQLLGVNGLVSPPNRMLLLDYLSSELQAMRMIGGDEDKMETDEEAVSPALQHLKAILAALNLPEPTKESTVFTLFSQIETTVQQLLRKAPKDHLGNPLLTKSLGHKQWSKVQEINSQLNQEYTLRRSMLLKRLDVTVQSFGWSDRAKVKKDEISSVFHPLRKSLSAMAPVSIPDIIAARSDLLRLTRTSSGEIREKTQCKINKVMMGKVPDRGGRPSNVAPPVEMPSFKKRTEAPRDQRPQSGRGARGGKVQGSWSGRGGGERSGQGGGWRGGRSGGREDQRGNFYGGGDYRRTQYYS